MTTSATPVGSQMLKGYFLLTLTALLWGTAFGFQKHASQYADAFTFNFLRFSVAIPALLLLCALPQSLFEPEQTDVPENKRWMHSAWLVGAGAGVLMFLGISLQQLGLAYTTTGKSGFLTSLYIIILPIMGLFFRQRCRIEVWIGIGFTILGIYLLGNTETGSTEGDFNIGDILTIICAFAWAGQVLWLGLLARYSNVLHVAIAQICVVAILSSIIMIMHGSLPSWDVIWVMRWDILYTGVISAALAFTLQILGQRYVPATNAAIIMSSEAMFALLVGVFFLGEVITITSLGACSLILIGIILAQLQGKIFRRPRA